MMKKEDRILHFMKGIKNGSMTKIKSIKKSEIPLPIKEKLKKCKNVSSNRKLLDLIMKIKVKVI